VEDKNKELSNEESLTEQQTWDVLEFANSITSGTFLANAITPYLLNERMKDATLNPYEVTSEKIAAALLSPKESEDELRGYSESLELNSMIYKRMLGYLSNLLSFDLTYVCMNGELKKYKKAEYKKDEQILFEFLDKFDVIQEFKKVMKQLLRQETFFGVLRDDGNKYVLQELPSQRCKIDGRFDYGLLFAFDMLWFQQPGVDIDLYPDVMKKMYAEWVGSGGGTYAPNLPVSVRGNSSWVQWVDCSPEDNFWCWKMTPEIATRIPYLSALFADLALQPLLREIQKNADVVAASKVLLGEIPYINKDLKGGIVKDNIAISPELLGKFLAILRQGLDSSIKIAAAPLKEMQAISFPYENKDTYSNYLKTTVASSGINTRISSGEKSTAIESQFSVDADTFLMTYIYPYFENFLEYHVNKRTKKYKFKFKFEGSEFSVNREKRLSVQLDLMEKGIVLPQKLSAAIGMPYQDMIRQMEMGDASGFIDKLTPIMNASQLGKDDVDSKGRPRKADDDLTESGDQTRADGSNIDKGGKI